MVAPILLESGEHSMRRLCAPAPHLRARLPGMLAAFLVPALLSAQAFAGVVVVVNSYSGADRKTPPQSGKMLIDGKKIRIEGTKKADAGAAMIFNGDTNELINLAPSKKKAMVIDVASIGAFANFQKTIEAQMEAQIAQAPPEQQGQMRQMLKAQMDKMNAPPPPRKVVKTSETKVISGVSTTKYEMRKGDKVVREIWVAPLGKVKGGKEVLAAMRQMAGFLDNVGRKIPGGNKSDAPFEAMLDIEGIPMLTIHLRDGKILGQEEIQSTKVQSVPAATFGIPAGFNRETLGDAIKGRHAGGPPGHGGLGQ